MSEDRRNVYQQLQRAREEYDYLKTIQNSCVTDYQAQIADLKQVIFAAFYQKHLGMTQKLHENNFY